MKFPVRRFASSIIALVTFTVIALLPIIGPAEEYRDRFESFPGKYGDNFFPDLLSQRNIHQSVAQIVAFMDTLHMFYLNVISEKWSLGQSHEERDIWCFRMSNNPNVDLNRPAILFDGLHHSGEWASTELVVGLAEYLAENYGSDPEITYLLDHREVYFVPIVNPDGRVYIEETGESWPKKNRRDNGDGTFGVDLNRNYPYMWGTTGHPDSDSTSCVCYRGPSAGSEPETQAIMGLVNSQDFVTHQSYHTPGSHTFYPWAYTTDSTPDSTIYTHMGKMMTKRNGYFHMSVSEFGVFSGTTIDWSYGAHGIFAFTNEVGILSDNLWPAIYLIQVAGPFVKTIDPAVVGGDANGHLDPGETAGLSFTLFNEGVRKDATGVTVRLASDDPYVQILEAERTVGTIGAFSTVDFSGRPFAATVDPFCPVGRMIGVDVTVVEPDGTRNYMVPYVVGGDMTLFSDDFETGTDGWTLTGTWGLTTANSNSPANSLTDSPGGNYMNLDTTSATITQPITAIKKSGLSLSFWHFYQTEEIFDVVEVQVSSEDGPWKKVARYTGTNSGWEQLELSLDEYAGKPVQIRFELLADWSEVEDGWYIDDVVIEGAPLTNLIPAPPDLISPTPGEVVSSDPTLIVANSSDPDGPGPLTYGFRIYADSLCTSIVASVDDLPEGIGQTTWNAPPLLDGNYWWRAYAADSVERGLLGETRSFVKKEVAVLIQRFEARRVDSTIRLTWDIITDESVSGFNIYRSKGQEGNEQLINEHGLIPKDDRSYYDVEFEAGQIYYYVLSVVMQDDSEVRSHPIELTTVPYKFSLAQNYPNPFNPATTIRYSISKSARVLLQIFDPQGRLIRTMVNRYQRAGTYKVKWHGNDEKGFPVASGIYFVRLKSREYKQTRKIILLK